MKGEFIAEYNGLSELRKHRSQLGEYEQNRAAIISHKFLAGQFVVDSHSRAHDFFSERS